MWLRATSILIVLWLCLGCEGNGKLTSLSTEEINTILSKVNIDDPEFVKKGVVFDSIITTAGHRSIADKEERVKSKLFFYGDYVRGYYNLSDLDDKNLQIFGRRTDAQLIFKSATKINMEESDGYFILKHDYQGIWSNGKVNFEVGEINMTKQTTDYNSLENW